MDDRSEDADLILAMLGTVLDKGPVSYTKLLTDLATRFGTTDVQSRVLYAYTALVKIGVLVSSTHYDGEPAIGPATQVGICAALEPYSRARDV